jgi:DNA gyrase subunit A
LIAIALRDDDQLIEAKLIDKNEDIMIGTRNGMAIRFNESDVRITGRSSYGVRGISLADDDVVVGMQKVSQGDFVLVVSEKGMGKLTSVSEFKLQKRGGKGLICYKITEKTGNLVGFKLTDKSREIMLITNEGVIIRMSLKDAKDIGRNTSGVKFMNIEADSNVVIASIAKVRESTTEADMQREMEEPENEDQTENEITD